VHPTAVVDPTAQLGEGVVIGAYCVVERGRRIGAWSTLYPGCFVGPNCQIGESTVLFPKVTVYENTEIGNRVRIHSGAVLGSDGFGYAPHRQGKTMMGHVKIYHLGQVVIEDDVEIGANGCVDRATFGQTRIGKGSKLDNLVHIGHNSTVGEGAIICGGTCLAGNVVLGRFVTIGGLTGITNHVHVQDGASVGAVSLVTKDVAPGGTAVGNPQRDYREHFKAHALLSRLLEERRKK
jgi:UDP-3-O-[3-hydroxymyristoyl] glucosamine N-acyltransferase